MHIEKCWYEYALLGRLAYDPTLTGAYFTDLMACRWDGAAAREDVEKLHQAMNSAGKVVPQALRYFWQNTDAYYPEMCLTHKTAFGFLAIRYWTNSDNTLAGAGAMSVPAYVEAVQAGQTEFDLVTPPEMVANWRTWADETMALVNEILSREPETYESLAQKEFYSTVKDQRLQAEMGNYYAEKTAAAIDLRTYSVTGDTARQDSAVSHLKNALVHWNTYAMDFASRYQPMLMGRLQLAPNPTELLTNVEKDISQAQSWKVGR